MDWPDYAFCYSRPGNYLNLMSTTRVAQHINAPRSAVFRALIDAKSVQQWMVPDGMTSEIHAFEPREGGAYRISLTYDSTDHAGKSSAHTDTHGGRFVKLVPDREVIQTTEFETSDPSMQGEMRMTFTLADAPGGGTQLTGLHENVPPGVPPEANEEGWRMSLAKLAKLVEGR
jgi:uncharacterized protein YndB with AHSA1/START domain